MNQQIRIYSTSLLKSNYKHFLLTMNACVVVDSSYDFLQNVPSGKPARRTMKIDERPVDNFEWLFAESSFALGGRKTGAGSSRRIETAAQKPRWRHRRGLIDLTYFKPRDACTRTTVAPSAEDVRRRRHQLYLTAVLQRPRTKLHLFLPFLSTPPRRVSFSFFFSLLFSFSLLTLPLLLFLSAFPWRSISRYPLAAFSTLIATIESKRRTLFQRLESGNDFRKTKEKFGRPTIDRPRYIFHPVGGHRENSSIVAMEDFLQSEGFHIINVSPLWICISRCVICENLLWWIWGIVLGKMWYESNIYTQ